MAHLPQVETAAPHDPGWLRLLHHAGTPALVYRLAGWRGPRVIGNGRLVMLEHRRGSARLRYHDHHRDGRDECLRRQAWALGVIARCGASRATLREKGCLAQGDPACEYVVTWTESPHLTPAALAGLLVTFVLTPTPVPGAAWLLVPTAIIGTYILERWRVTHASPAAVAHSAAAFRLLVARALEGRPAPVSGAAGPSAISLEQEGEFWRIGYEGTTVLLRHSRGLALLAHLVRNPGQEMHVSELDSITPSGGSAVARNAPVPEGGVLPVAGDAGEILDPQARMEYRRRIAELHEELEDAEAAHDLGRAETMRAELELLEDELRAAVGPGGRVRRAGDDAERLRVAITRRIRAAIAQIAKHHAALGAHLAASVSTGYRCVYEPAERPGVGERAAQQRERKA